MGRGRPKAIIRDPEDEPRKFTREHTGEDGVISVWTYDLDVTTRGPICVEQIYPKNYLTPLEIQAKNNKHLPRRLQTFLNPATGKTVGYHRALQLEITDEDNAKMRE